MNKCIILFWIGTCFLRCGGRDPFKPKPGSFPFVVYFPSRYRGLCVGTLVSKTAVLTAAVCVTNPIATIRDTRPINVVTGTQYRHPRRGIRVQVTKILVPNLQLMAQVNRGYLMSQSAAILLLKKRIPDVLAEHPLRPIQVEYLDSEGGIHLNEECIMPGWHFFFKGDTIYPVHKFLLQRSLRVQFVNVVRKSLWCEALSIKFQKALSNMGFFGFFDKSASICVRDPDRRAQPCHGSYGSPLVCKGKVYGMLMSPDSQWSNCTGFSNIVHLLSSKYLRTFMSCVSRLFDTTDVVNWDSMKKAVYDRSSEEYDALAHLYDKVAGGDSEESD